MINSYDQLWQRLPPPEKHIESGGSFWRKEDPVVNADGKVTKGGLFGHQRDFIGLPNFIKVLVMGYGGGKSLILGKRMISLALQNAPMPAAVICPSYPMAKLTAIPTIKALLEGKRQLLGGRFRYKFNGQTPMFFKIEYRGREAYIYILSSDRPDSLKGSNLCGVALEEPFIQPISAFEQAVARVRVGGGHQEIILAGTPEQLNWGYELCEGELRNKYDVGVIRGSTLMNRTLREDYGKRMLAGFDEKAARAYVHGEFVNLSSGLVYYAFDKAEHVVERSIPRGARLGLGMDFNVNPMACCVFWWKGDQMHILEEHEFPNADTEYACQVIRERWGDHIKDVFPDATGKARQTNAPGGRSDFTILREHKFTINAKSVNPSVRDRYNAANGKLKPAEDSKLTLTVSPKCTKLIKYFAQYTHELKHTKEQDAMSHLLDAATYPIAYLWPIERGQIVPVKHTGQ